MELPVFEPGVTLVAEDRWHDVLWAAVPQRVIKSSRDELVSYVPTGAVATRASSRGLPGAEHLTRDERKLLSLRTGSARVVEVLEAPDKLFFYRPGRWSRINLGWDHRTRDFLGWYVNFEFPARATPTGLCTMDLVLDIWVNPDRSWEWKDRNDYRELLGDGTLEPEIDHRLQHEADSVVDEISERSGPFAESWMIFEADPAWPRPELPSQFSWGGDAWSLSPGSRLPDRS